MQKSAQQKNPSLRISPLAIQSLLCILSLVSLSAQAQYANLDRATTEYVAGDSAGAEWPRSIVAQVKDPSGNPIPHVSFVFAGQEVETNEKGQITLSGVPATAPILIKKPGYRKMQVSPQHRDLEITLEPLSIQGVYLSPSFVVNNADRYVNALKLLQETELNAVVIDVKDDDGNIHTNLKQSVAQLRSSGIYTIARIVTFKDIVAVRKHPELGLQATNGQPWQDAKHVTYLDPFNKQSWDYVLAVAKQAADDGFDEIQFDYVRFPTDGNRSTIVWKTLSFDKVSRTQAIAGFLERARHELGPKGVFVAADVFGITAYDSTDSGIGQTVEAVTKYLDYACPMVYPSGFAMNSGGVIGSPVDHPGQIVEDSVRRYRMRADKDSVVRPWLQAFRDYSYNHRDYSAAEIGAQILGSEKAKGQGFLLWNAGSKYTAAGLKPKALTVKNRLTLQNP